MVLLYQFNQQHSTVMLHHTAVLIYMYLSPSHQKLILFIKTEDRVVKFTVQN